MIRLIGNLELKSADQLITFTGDEDQMILHIEGWPKNFRPSTLKLARRFEFVDLAPIRVEYKNNYLATFHKMKISKINLITGIKALFGYINSKF